MRIFQDKKIHELIKMKDLKLDELLTNLAGKINPSEAREVTV